MIFMDMEDILPKKRADALAMVEAQDLDPLSAEELQERIARLRAEIGRTEQRLSAASAHRADAEALFRKG